MKTTVKDWGLMVEQALSGTYLYPSPGNCVSIKYGPHHIAFALDPWQSCQLALIFQQHQVSTKYDRRKLALMPSPDNRISSRA